MTPCDTPSGGIKSGRDPAKTKEAPPSKFPPLQDIPPLWEFPPVSRCRDFPNRTILPKPEGTGAKPQPLDRNHRGTARLSTELRNCLYLTGPVPACQSDRPCPLSVFVPLVMQVPPVSAGPSVASSQVPARGLSAQPSRGLLVDWDPLTYQQTVERFAGHGAVALPRPEAASGSPFPFLLRVLDAKVPPPIMLHPHWEQALAGFVREQARGVPMGAGNRNYKDRNPKCEVAIALTPLRVLAGERTVEELRTIASGLELPWLRSYLSFRHETAIHSILRMSREETAAALRETADAVERIPDVAGPAAEAVTVVRRLQEQFPNDRGILLSICMKLIELDPGHALVIPPGCLHTYLSGQAVLVMGISHNALHAGLTKEHVDLCELQTLTGNGQPQPSPLPVFDVGNGEQRIPLWSEDLDLRRVVIGNEPKPVRVGPFSVVLAALDPAGITVDEVTAHMEPEAKVLYAGEPATATFTGPSQVFVASAA